MESLDKEQLQSFSGSSESERKSCFLWLARLPEGEKEKVILKGYGIALGLKERHPSLTLARRLYLGLLAAIRRAGWGSKKCRVVGPAQCEDLEKRRNRLALAVKPRRTAPLAGRVAAYWGEVVSLRLGGSSFRVIAAYLKKVHHLAVSGSYLYKLWREKEGGRGAMRRGGRGTRVTVPGPPGGDPSGGGGQLPGQRGLPAEGVCFNFGKRKKLRVPR